MVIFQPAHDFGTPRGGETAFPPPDPIQNIGCIPGNCLAVKHHMNWNGGATLWWQFLDFWDGKGPLWSSGLTSCIAQATGHSSINSRLNWSRSVSPTSGPDLKSASDGESTPALHPLFLGTCLSGFSIQLLGHVRPLLDRLKSPL